MHRSSVYVTTLVLGLSLMGCSSGSGSSKSASQSVTMAGQAPSELYAKAKRALLKNNYQIKSSDDASLAIQAFRPMTGAFSRPGYGHNVTILISGSSIEVTAFPMEGVAGGESPEQIRDEVLAFIQGAK